MTNVIDPTAEVSPSASAMLSAQTRGWTRHRYTSAEVFNEECARILERTWTCVAHSSALPGPGSFVRTQVGNENIIIVRNREERLRAMINLCQHRGTVLCHEDKGNFGRSIRCIYHGWTYNLDGNIVGIPLRRELPPDAQNRHLRQVAVEERLGHVWVNLSEDTSPLDDYLQVQMKARFGSGANPIQHYELDTLRLVHTIEYDVHANWKLIWENFHECYHCPALHPEISSVIPYFRKGWGTVTNADSLKQGLGTPLADNMQGFSMSGKAVAEPLPGLPQSERRMLYGLYAAPSVSMTMVPDHVYFMIIHPLGPDRTKVVGEWLFHPDAINSPSFNATDAIDVFDITNRQDFEACERMQQGANSRFFENAQMHAPHEYLIDEFRKRVDAALLTGNGFMMDAAAQTA